VRSGADLQQVWQQGERLAATFDRAISTTPLLLPEQMLAAALGGVETDGRLFRLHFLLFDDLWPTDPAQSRAEGVFEIDPANGVLRSWTKRR
jgi:hypothetical protein